MAEITPEQEIALREDRLLSLMQVIADLRRQIVDLTKGAKTGGDIDNNEAKKRLSEFNTVIVQCLKTEMTLDECRNKQAGVMRGGYALDMDRARVDIGCKLDQLRRCSCPGELLE